MFFYSDLFRVKVDFFCIKSARKALLIKLKAISFHLYWAKFEQRCIAIDAHYVVSDKFAADTL